MITLNRAIALASEAHSGSSDKAGQPYILHPLRVMLAQETDEARIVAVFHDVLEDVAGWDVARLRTEGFTEGLIGALEALTKRPEEEGTVDGYMRFLTRAGANPIARMVKIADLRDNLDRRRIANPSDKDIRRWEKYEQALQRLEPMRN